MEIHTPDRESQYGWPDEAMLDFRCDQNSGVCRISGVGSTRRSLSTQACATGKAAGDVYTTEKRRLGGRAVSGDAVGIDCSGFISRCWKLPRKYSTSTLPEICQKLSSPDQLRPADVYEFRKAVMVVPALSAGWTKARTRALFYEAAPYSKTLGSERDMATLLAAGYTPLRYRRIVDTTGTAAPRCR